MNRHWTDFNGRHRDGALTANIDWWDEAPVRGQRVVLADHEGNVCEGNVVAVTKRPDREARQRGLMRVHPDMATWVDGEVATALALAWVKQPTRNVPAWVTA